MSKLTRRIKRAKKRTENITMADLRDKGKADTNHEERFPMAIETNIVFFTMNAESPNDADIAWTTEHGMYLLDRARITPDKEIRSIIASIVFVVGHMLDIDTIRLEACNIFNEVGGIPYPLHEKVGNGSAYMSEYRVVLNQLLEMIGIDSSKKQEEIDEIHFRHTLGRES